MKANLLPPHNAIDGTEEMVGVIGAPGAKQVVRMPAAIFAAAGTRPTPEELAAAVMTTIAEGSNIELVDNGDGTVSLALKASPALEGNPTAPTPAANDNDTSIATTGFVKAALDALALVVNAALDDKQGTLLEGANIDLVDNGDGTFTISSTGGGGGVTGSSLSIPGGAAGTEGGQLSLGYDGTSGVGNSTWNIDVAGANAFRIFRLGVDGTPIVALTINEATGLATFSTAPSVPDQAYSAAWDGSSATPTRNAVYDKVEALVSSIAGKVAASAVGAANGVASLDGSGQVPASQLPSYVDDVLEFANVAAFPNPGVTGKIYVALDTLKQSRWSGSAYQELTASPGTTDAVPEGAGNLYFTEPRVRAAIATGLIDTAGTPAATDSVLTVLGKIKKALFTDLPATVRGTAATGLADTAGTPAAADSILTILGKLRKAVYTDAPLAYAPRLPNIQAVASAATVTPTFANDQVNITAQAAALALANWTGTAVDGWGIATRVKDNGTARAITYGTQYRAATGVTLPTTTVVGKTLYICGIWNAADSKIDVVAVAEL